MPAYRPVPEQGKPACLLIASAYVAQGEIEALEDAANELMLADEEQVRTPILVLLLMAAARLPDRRCVVQARYGIGDCFLAATPDEAEAYLQEGSLQQSSSP